MAAQWPPRSPHEALLSTPGGREKLRRLAERTSPSPSPSRLRASRSAAALTSRSGTAFGEDGLFEGGDDDNEEDEDEETLQLKLQALQARLKLKKLQAAKAQKKSAAASQPGSGDVGGMREVPLQSRLAAARDRMERQASSRDIVQVPASPVKKVQAASDLQTSPQRVLLGIDKGLRGADVSLKKAPSQRRANDAQLAPSGGFLRRAKSPLSDHSQQEASRPLSFNERLAAARTEEAARQERRERARNLRSTAFNVGRQEMEDYKTKAQDLPDLPSKPQEFSRDEVLASMGRSSGTQIPRSSTAPTLGSGARIGNSDSTTTATKSSSGSADLDGSFEPYSGLHLSKRILPHNVLARAVSGKKTYLLKDLLRQVKAPDWSLPDDETDIVVFAIVASKSDPRSHRPGPGKDGKSQQDRGKYMVLTLVDLTYEVDLFLFNSGFDRFWKLTPGTVLAILNPGILPPPPGREATNRFGLMINSDEDTILEIGGARDIGYCKSIKKDGTYCKSWVNARRTEYCEFHTNEAVRKARSSRIEMSTTAGFGGGDVTRWRKHNSRQVFVKSEEERARGHYDRATQSQYFISTAHRATDPDDERLTGIADRKEREAALKRRLAQAEKERDIARRLGEVGGGAGREYMSRAAATAAAAHRTTTKGSTPAAALGSSFSSSSAVTTSFSSAPPPTNDQQQQPARKWDARSLGLVGRHQPKISLGPAPTTTTTAAKRKRPESAGSAATSTSTTAANGNIGSGGGGGSKAPLGWGALLKDKLGRMREGERLDGRTAPSAPGLAAPGSSSSTATGGGAADGSGGGGGGIDEKGIREAGRESLGERLSAAGKVTRRRVVLPDRGAGGGDDDDDDDDDLIILR
ncbi:80d3c72f-2274-4d1e-887f-f1446bafdcb2 [Thermothielavioides terrestris]|uniref:80d3c72f-2274-4d1e-887f-f1446bafdcb2 n=1 Tax=Thermothielavioides terrestris TaxID=2587410 RepID=A0A3S4F4I6_9PEZI|nr:80d3c72f-2274-4d1e-887f-f1446bafdcb2 [Thermothielavioides terrestris]